MARDWVLVMDPTQPPEGHGFLTDIGISIIFGLIATLMSIVAWFTKDHVKELKEMRAKIQEMEINHQHCVTRNELDDKFDIMREDQNQRHQENSSLLKELRDGYRTVHQRIDELLVRRQGP